jgi:YbbR domain-containing protein
VTRVLSIITHNWPLKVAAVVLASLLYVGLVLAQNSKETRVQIPIDVRNQPAQAAYLSGVQYVTSIRYFAPADLASRIGSDDFTAWIDLAGTTPDSSNDVVVKVNVSTADPQIQVLDWTPRQISVRLDPLTSRIVPVQVDSGTKPPGLDVRDPIVDVRQVTVSGTQSAVSQVVAAVARVRIDPSGLKVDQQVDLVAVDVRGVEVSPVTLKPSSVHVTILIGSQLTSRPLPINAIVTGTPATGFELTSVALDTPTVTLEGDADILNSLTKIDTLPLSISGARANVTGGVGLVLPDGVDVLGISTVRITATIEATQATRTFSVGIVLSGAQADRTYALSTDQVLVTLGGPAAALASLQGDALVVTADVDGLGAGAHQLSLKTTLPAGITLIAVNPPKVTVTITVPEPPSPSPSLASPSPSVSPVP